jgi:hypothetical protein
VEPACGETDDSRGMGDEHAMDDDRAVTDEGDAAVTDEGDASVTGDSGGFNGSWPTELICDAKVE